MTTAEILKSLILKGMLIAALVGCATAYADQAPIQVAMEDGKTTAKFNIGDSRCVLVDGQIRCTLDK
jgi:hypothetical protein